MRHPGPRETERFLAVTSDVQVDELQSKAATSVALDVHRSR